MLVGDVVHMNFDRKESRYCGCPQVVFSLSGSSNKSTEVSVGSIQGGIFSE